MEGPNLLVSAFFFLAAAVAVVPFARRGGLGSVLGYLVAGVLIGPYALGLVTNAEDILHFAEFGVVMMLFLVGLELEPAKLWRLRVPILGMGGAQVAATTVVLALIAMMLGQTWQSGVAIGMALSLSSTAIALQILNERHALGTSAGQSAFSVLLFQDVAVIPILAVLPLLASGAVDGSAAASAAAAGPGWLRALTVFGAVAGIFLAGRYALRPLFRFIAGSGLREIFTATALLLVVGIALLMQLIGLSPALGTFLAGVVLANSEYRLALESDIEPFKALLLGLFFISVGMSINFGVLGDHPALIAAIVIGMIALKLVVLVGLAHAFGLRSEQKLLFSFLLAQGGEFAFVLFQFAAAEGAIATEVAKMLVVVVALTMAATPLMMLFLDRTLQPLWSGGGAQREPDKVEPQGHPVIVIGYGRFGQIVGRFLSASGVGMVILDNDPNHVEVLRKFGVRAFYGDATRLDLLEAAGGERARLFVVAIDDQDKAVATVRAIRGHFPHAKVFARARNRDHVYDLWDAGAHFTRRETFDAALVMGREALVALGEHPFAARRRARMFIEHDEGMLAEGFAVRDSDESLVKLSRQAREQLERLVAIDKGATPAEKDHGWGD